LTLLLAEQCQDDFCLKLGSKGSVFLGGHMCLSGRYSTACQRGLPRF
jgi:hypothetical protein